MGIGRESAGERKEGKTQTQTVGELPGASLGDHDWAVQLALQSMRTALMCQYLRLVKLFILSER